MVRHGTAKKRRRGLKVTKKSLPKNSNLKVINAVRDNTCKSSWDKSKTPAENLKAMGLDPNPNLVIRTEPLDPNNVGFVGYMNTSESPDPVAEADANPKRKKMSEYDQTYILKLMKAHGKDCMKMQRDLKLNFNQNSEHQLQKMVEKYSSLPESQKFTL